MDRLEGLNCCGSTLKMPMYWCLFTNVKRASWSMDDLNDKCQ